MKWKNTLLALVPILLLSLTGTVSAWYYPTDGLVAYWDLDESSGNMTDIHRGIHNGTPINNITRGVEGVERTAYLFNETGSPHINVSDDDELDFDDTGNFTLSFWIRTDAATSASNIFKKRNLAGDRSYNFFLELNATSGEHTLKGRVFQGDTTQIQLDSQFDYNLTNYTHIVLLTNGTDVKFYVNGSETDYISYDGTIDPSTADFLVGSTEASFTDLSLDEIGLWNRTLTDTEISYLYEDFIMENSQTFNTVTYESSQETFILNLSYNSVEYTSIVGNLVYNGTSYAGTRTGTDNEAVYTREITIPNIASTQNYTFYWEIILTNASGDTYFNSTFNNQTVNNISLSICGGPGGDVPYLNFTFRNETDGTTMSALNDLTDFTYWITEEDLSLSYITTNTTANPSYAFCFTPPDTPVIVDLSFKYSASGFPLRTFQYDSETLSNTTTNQVLYLLDSSSGIYSTIQTTESLGAPIEGVSLVVERQFSGVWTTIEQGITGTDGAATFWVNPNFDHRITATLTGYTTAQVTIRPSQSTYTIIMDTGAGNATYVSDLPGVKWIVLPSPGVINNGTYNFNATVTSSQQNLENCRFELLNATNTSQVLATSTSLTNSSYCRPSFNYALVNDQNVFGRLSIDTTSTDGYVVVDTDWRWTVFSSDVAGWRTITSFFEELRDLSEFGEGNEREFSRYMFFFLVSTILLAVFFYFSGFEINNPGSALLIIWIIVIFASVAGFLTFDSGSDNIDAIWEQYAFLLMFSLLSAGFMFNKWRKDSE